jgi:hypothetical protein
MTVRLGTEDWMRCITDKQSEAMMTLGEPSLWAKERARPGRSHAWCYQCCSTSPSMLCTREIMGHLAHMLANHTNSAQSSLFQHHSLIIFSSAPGASNGKSLRQLWFRHIIRSLPASCNARASMVPRNDPSPHLPRFSEMAASTLTSIVSFDGGVHLASEEDSRL